MVATLGFLAASCGKKPKQESPVGRSTAAAPAADAAAGAPQASVDATPKPKHDQVRTIALSGDTSVPVPHSGLTVRISGSFHKIRAPLVGVSILVSRLGDKAEVEWRIESGRINTEWREIQGRRWDAESNTYVEEKIPGWLVRLDSVDGSSAGGDPRAITISVKEAPQR